jgi:hypothetical protein
VARCDSTSGDSRSIVHDGWPPTHYESWLSLYISENEDACGSGTGVGKKSKYRGTRDVRWVGIVMIEGSNEDESGRSVVVCSGEGCLAD